MKLQEILESQARFCQRIGISVEMHDYHGWVDIKDDKGNEILLQGDDADTFIIKVADLTRKCPDMAVADVALACAYDFAHILAEM